MSKNDFNKIVFILLGIFCLTPYIDPPLALLMGLILSQIMAHPFKKQNSKATKLLLQISVVGLGFGMNLFEAAKAGQKGLLFTIFTIILVLGIGFLLGKVFSVNKKTTILTSVGTAICGGSAIAAVSPIIEAKEEEVSVSLGIVFILNAIALFLFPSIGHYLNLTQEQFGVWSAIAIHDTSSVVGAAQKYGAEALQIATTIKLERALWIIPISLITAFLVKKENTKVQIPYFIGYFVIAMTLNTFLPFISFVSPYLVYIAKKGLTVTLFLIGSGLSKDSIKEVGFKPMLLGVILWLIISSVSLFVILSGFA